MPLPTSVKRQQGSLYPGRTAAARIEPADTVASRLRDPIVTHYFIPSFLPWASKAMDSRTRRCRVSALLATAIQAM